MSVRRDDLPHVGDLVNDWLTRGLEAPVVGHLDTPDFGWLVLVDWIGGSAGEPEDPRGLRVTHCPHGGDQNADGSPSAPNSSN